MEIIPCGECGGCLLRRVSAECNAELAELVSRVIYREGELIFQQGTPVLGFHFIGQGKAKLFRRFKDGRKRLIQIAQRGDMLDMSALQRTRSRSTSAEALTECQICFIREEDLFSWVGCHPSVANRLIRRLSQEVRRLQVELVDTSYMGIRERLVNLLLRLTRHKDGSRHPVDLYEAEIAEMLGVSRESVVRHLGRLKQRGTISVEDRRVVIRDREHLARLQDRS